MRSFDGKDWRRGVRVAFSSGGLLLALALSGSLVRSAQCVAGPAGCPLELDTPVSGIIAVPGDDHVWRLDVADPTDVRLELTDVATDFQFYVYRPGETEATHPTDDESGSQVLELPGAAGTYQVIVHSPGYESSSQPYRLSAERVATIAPPVTGVTSPILLSDNFDDATAGRLPRTGTAESWTRGYVDGEYRIAKLDAAASVVPNAALPGRHSDATIAVDVRLVGDIPGRNAYVSCRAQADNSQYRLVLSPGTQAVTLFRFDAATSVQLARSVSEAVRPGAATNRLELSCLGTSITGTANGFRLFTVEDATYREGISRVGAFATNQLVEARFDNLVLATEPQGLAVAPPPTFTPTPGRPTNTPRPAPTPTPVPGPYDGLWGARTSTGSTINLTVAGGQVTAMTVDYGIRGDSCTVSGTRTVRLGAPQTATGVPFTLEQGVASTLRFTQRPGAVGEAFEVDATITFRVEGRFTSLTAGNGTFVFSVSAPQAPCQGSERGTWTVTRSAP